MSRLLETWCLMEYAEKGSLADALRTGRLKRPGGFPELGVIIACLQDIASGEGLAAPGSPACHRRIPAVLRHGHRLQGLLHPGALRPEVARSWAFSTPVCFSGRLLLITAMYNSKYCVRRIAFAFY